MLHKLLFAPALLLASSQAFAQECEPALLSGDQTVTINGVEIAPGSVVTEMVHLRVGNEAGAPGASGSGADDPGITPTGPVCPGVIRFSRIDPVGNPYFPDYVLMGPGNDEIEILPDASSGGTARSDLRIANLPPGPQGREVPLRVHVATEWGLRAGTYTERLLVSIFDETGQVADTGTLTITIVIPPVVSIMLVGDVSVSGAGPARVDLGDISRTEETQSNPFAARIFSTSAYRVTFDSANLGWLQHDNGSDRIDYNLYFDGQLVELGGANAFPYPDHTPSEGFIHPLKVVVPPVVAVAGRYSDRVTITVSAI